MIHYDLILWWRRGWIRISSVIYIFIGNVSKHKVHRQFRSRIAGSLTNLVSGYKSKATFDEILLIKYVKHRLQYVSVKRATARSYNSKQKQPYIKMNWMVWKGFRRVRQKSGWSDSRCEPLHTCRSHTRSGSQPGLKPVAGSASRSPWASCWSSLGVRSAASEDPWLNLGKSKNKPWLNYLDAI